MFDVFFLSMSNRSEEITAFSIINSSRSIFVQHLNSEKLTYKFIASSAMIDEAMTYTGLVVT